MGLVREHEGNLQSHVRKTVDTEDDQSVNMADWVMITKVRKHVSAGNQRKAAQYVTMRLEEDPRPLSEWARKQMRLMPLKHNKSQILYQNKAGEVRAFDFVRAQLPGPNKF